MSEQSDISILFATDPLRLTREDRREKMIPYFRDNREKYLSGGKAERAPKAEKKNVPDISLDDLEL